MIREIVEKIILKDFFLTQQALATEVEKMTQSVAVNGHILERLKNKGKN